MMCTFLGESANNGMEQDHRLIEGVRENMRKMYSVLYLKA